MSDPNCLNCHEQISYDPPQVVYEDYYHPQVVNIVHSIEVIRRHHCVPVPHHIYTCSVKDMWVNDPAAMNGMYRGGSKSRPR